MHAADLSALVETCRHGSMTEAAAALELPPSTLVRRLRRLTRELRFPLLVTDRRGSVPTSAGRRTAAAAAEILTVLTTALAEAGAPAADPATIDLDHLDLLGQVVAAGSIRRAAAARDVLPQALSRVVQRLERQVGVPLVSRSAGGTTATAAAVRLLAAAAAIRAVRDALRRDLACPDGLTVRLGHQSRTLAELARWAAEERPGLRVEAAQLPPERALPALAAGDLDAVQFYRNPTDPPLCGPALRTRAIAEQPVWVVLPEGHRLARAAAIVLADLADDDWVVQAPGTADRELVLAACRAAGFAPRILGAASDSAAVEDYISTRGCVTLGSPLNPPTPGWTMRPLATPVSRTLLLAWHPGRVPEPVAGWLAARIRRWYADAAATRNPEYAAALSPPWPTRPAA